MHRSLAPNKSLIFLAIVLLQSSLYAMSDSLAWSFFASASEAGLPRRAIPGGYAPIDDLEQESVQKAAGWAYKVLTKEIVQEDAAQAPYEYSFLSKVESESMHLYKWRIIKGYQQVVAGMNYRLILSVNDVDKDDCIGGFAVTIYDHFGELSITQWGKEVDCDALDNLQKSKAERLADLTPEDPNE
jgi:hypothetical protein